MQGGRSYCQEGCQASQAFKLTGSVNHQVGLSERVSCITPDTFPYTSVSSIEQVNSGSNEVSATSVVGEQVESTSVVEDVHRIVSVRAPGQLIWLAGLVNKSRAVVMVDSGSTGDFISQAFVSKHKLGSKSYESSRTLWLADGKQHTVTMYIECLINLGGLIESAALAIIP